MKQYNSPYLAHYGVKGMRWGIRKEYKPVGRRRSKPKQANTEDTKNKGLTDKQKRAIKIGAAAAATTLAVWGGYRLYKSGKLDNIIDKDSKTTNFAKGVLDSNTGLELQSNPLSKSLADNVKAVNPKFSHRRPEYYTNCGNCAIAFEARMRGFDVTARGNRDGMTKSQIGQFFKGFTEQSFSEVFIDTAKLSTDKITRGNQVKSAIEKTIINSYKNDKSARGMLFCPADYGNHWISWIKDGDNIIFVDSQDNKGDLIKDVFAHYQYNRNSSATALTAIRLDNLDINSDTIHNVIENVNIAHKFERFNAYVEKGANFIMK